MWCPRCLPVLALTVLAALPVLSTGPHDAAIVRIGYYVGNGTSSHADGEFFATLRTAASQAFGGEGSFAITNMTETGVRSLTPGQFSVMVFPGGSGNGTLGDRSPVMARLRDAPVRCRATAAKGSPQRAWTVSTGHQASRLPSPALNHSAPRPALPPPAPAAGQATAIGEEGLAAVRRFVAAGGAYIGTCGGAFLALQHLLLYGLGPAGKGPPTQEPWDRGHGPVGGLRYTLLRRGSGLSCEVSPARHSQKPVVIPSVTVATCAKDCFPGAFVH